MSRQWSVVMPKMLRLVNPRWVGKRKCGACVSCCIVPSLAVPPYKPFGERCSEVCKKGCGIYERRPDGCRSYECHWLLNGFLETKHRPDKTGIVFDDGEIRKEEVWAALQRDLGLEFPPVTAREVWAGAFKKESHLLKMIATKLVVIMVPVPDSPNAKLRVIGPNQKVIDAVWDAVMAFAKEKGVEDLSERPPLPEDRHD